jgi:AbrB family looped-hinge helix DNA binding protein
MIVYVNDIGRVTIPSPVRKALNIQPHDALFLKVVDNQIIMTPEIVDYEEKYLHLVKYLDKHNIPLPKND